MWSAPLVVLFLSSCTLLLCDDMNITVTAGENVTLECRPQVSKNGVIVMLMWEKTDPKSEQYVFYFNEPHYNGEYQDERFRGRVDLRDPDMKNGDVSLKNVTVNDSGTYECKVKCSKRSRVRRHEPEPVSVVKLTVRGPGRTDGHTGGDKGGGDEHGHFGLIGVAVIGVIVTGLILESIRRRNNSD